MRLTKAQRATLREMFGGRCAYCGETLPERGWHADHVERVERKLKRLPDGKVVTTSEAHRPERDTIENMMPACAPCNIDKHWYSVDEWRDNLQRRMQVLRESYSTVRSMLRFGQLQETSSPIVFHFERVAQLNHPLKRCAAGRDGDCIAGQCPQLRDGEPVKSGRHCPLDTCAEAS